MRPDERADRVDEEVRSAGRWAGWVVCAALVLTVAFWVAVGWWLAHHF